MTQPIAVATVITANYLAQARTMFESLRRHHPEVRGLVLLVDRVEGRFDPAQEPFEVLPVEALDFPHLHSFLFQHTPFERVQAFKPWALEHAWKHFSDCEHLFYLDADLYITGRMDLALERLATADAVLTPQILSPVPDRRPLNELLFLRTGTFNMGFLGLRRSNEAQRLVSWWKEKLLWGCAVNLRNGFFADQKWMDLAPSFCERLAVLRDPGYNAAVWNLAERLVERNADTGAWTAGGRPLVFFHFSGYDPRHGEALRPQASEPGAEADSPAVRILAQEYGQRLSAQGWEHCHAWAGVYDRYTNGRPVPPVCHLYYRDVLRFRMPRDRDPYAGLPFSPALSLLQCLVRDPRYFRDGLWYGTWLAFLKKLGVAPDFERGPPETLSERWRIKQ